MQKKTKILLAAIIGFALVTRAWRVWQPSEYYFDEVYHAYTAAFYAANDPAGYEWWHTSPDGVAIEWLHPPVSKLLMGGSIYLFGDVSWAWRLPGVVFGGLVVWATFLLAREISQKDEVGLVAALVASWDGLLLTMSRITMNDIYVTFFMLMSLWSYWKLVRLGGKKKGRGFWLAVSGVMAGLAIATKWSGVFVLGVFGGWELWRLVKGETGFEPVWWLKKIVAWGVVPVLVYVLSFSQWWWQGHTWKQFGDLHRQIWWYQTNLEATHPWQSKPWQWVLNLKPVWFWVGYEGTVEGNIYAFANPVLAWGGLVAMGYLAYEGYRKKRFEYWFVVLSYLWVWVPWSFSPRIMFYYHYTPAIPLLVVAMGVWLVDWVNAASKTKKWVGLAVMGGLMSCFVLFYPFWTGMLIPREWVARYKLVYEWPKLIGWRVE